MEHKPIHSSQRTAAAPAGQATEVGGDVVPGGQTLSSWLNSRIARYETRSLDWHALKFQADYDQKYRRAQMRYIGTGGTGVDSDENTVPAEHFTFSTMVLPAGCEGPLHLHVDAEEVFFVLRGNKLRFIIEHEGERFETVLKERDLFSVPPGVYRGLVNEGIEEALMCVMIGNSKPVTPTYPPDHPLSKIKRPKGAGAG
jgi:quercetin dioxygenase-like cupin family protein